MTHSRPHRYTTTAVHSGVPSTHRLLAGLPRRVSRHRPTERRLRRLSGATRPLHTHEYAPAVTATVEGHIDSPGGAE